MTRAQERLPFLMEANARTDRLLPLKQGFEDRHEAARPPIIKPACPASLARLLACDRPRLPTLRLDF